MKSLVAILIALTLPLGLISLGCAGDDDEDSPTGSDLEPTIVNGAAAFQFALADVRNATTTLTYVWNNSGTQARINHFSSISGGSASIFIDDADGNQVFFGNLMADGTGVTIFGTPGAWTIRLDMDGFTGTADFVVERI